MSTETPTSPRHLTSTVVLPDLVTLQIEVDGDIGTLTLNRTTHTIASRSLSLLQHIGSANGTDKVLATFDIGGRNYKKVSNPT